MSHVAPSIASPARGSTVLVPDLPSNATPAVLNLGTSSSNFVSSTTGEKPLAQVVSLVSGVTSIARQILVVGQPVVVVPSINFNMVISPSTTGQPSGV